MAGVGGVSVALLREMVANHLLSTFCTANIYMPVQVLSINTFSRLENSVKKKKRKWPHMSDHCCPHSISILPTCWPLGYY